LHDAGKAIASEKEGIWGFAWDQSERPYEILPLGQSLGGVALSEDGLTATGYMDSDPFVEAFTFMQSLYNDGVSPRGLFDIPVVWELFSTGKLGMMVGLTAAWDTLVKSGVNFGVAPMPYFEKGKPVSTTGGWTFGINPRTANRDAAEAFIRALMTPEVQETFLRKRPYPPFLSALWERMADFYSGDLWTIVRYDYENTAVPRPSTPGYREYEEILRLALRDIQTGSDPKSTLTAAAQKTDRELQKYRS
jgi:multiple sugar transport system substrate-binding protein